MASRTEQLMQDIRKMPIFHQLVPMEAGIGWPMPRRAGGQVYVTLPFYGFLWTPEQRSWTLFPPISTITVQWSNLVPVEYVDLRYSRPWPEGQGDSPVGTFPHDAVAALTREQYEQDRSELLTMYDELFDTLVLNKALPPFWNRRFGQLLRRFLEPALEPYYRGLAPKFFAQFLSFGESETEPIVRRG